MTSYFSLLHPYFWQLRNHFRKSSNKRQTIKRDLLMCSVTALLLLCIYAGVAMILWSVSDDLVFREIIPAKLIELLSYVFLILQFFGALIAFTGNIYHSDSMNLHLSTPLHTHRMFLNKFIETFCETTFMYAVFTLPIGIAYLQILDAPPTFLLAGIVLSIPFLIIPCALGFIAATLTSYLTSVLWKRGFILLIGVGLAVTWLIAQLIFLLNKVQLHRGGENAIVHLISLFDNPNPLWVPSHWLSGILCNFISTNNYPLALGTGMLSLAALASYATAYLVFDYLFLAVRSRAFSHDGGGSTGTELKRSDWSRDIVEAIYYRLPIDQQQRAIMLKDMSTLIRDKSQSLKLLLYLGIAVSYLVLIEFLSSALILDSLGMSAWWSFLCALNVLFSGFILTAAMTRLVYPSISLEGKSFWIMNCAPLALGDLIRAKFICWLPLATILCTSLLLTGLFIVHVSVAATLLSILLGVCLSAGCTALAIGIGALFARFEWESANQLSSGLGTLVLFFFSLVFVSAIAVFSFAAYLVVVPLWNWAFRGFELSLALSAALICILLITSVVVRKAREIGARALIERRV